MEPEERRRLVMGGPEVDELRANDCGVGATTNQPVDFLEGSTRAQMCSKSEDTRNLLIVNCSTCGSCAV